MKQSLGVQRNNINSRPIILVLIGLGFMSVILAATIFAAQGSNHNSNGGLGQQASSAEVSPKLTADDMILAVVEKLDTENQQITLYDVNNKEVLHLFYSGGTNITDKYGQIISMSQIKVGTMVDAAYSPDIFELTNMNISTRAWEYSNVNNINIDDKNQIIKIASKMYQYTKDIFVLDGINVVAIRDLAEQDVLTVWGDDQTIWSIIVSKGHGTVRLKDYDEYLGDRISIGYESMLQITKDFEIPVREGRYNLTVENGLYSATKSVTVKRNKTTYVSLGDIGLMGLKQCSVTFDIKPFGADLFIDGKLTSYADPIQLSYGSHSIKVSLGGYSTYDGTIDADTESKSIKIKLPEDKSNGKTVITEDNTGSSNKGTGGSNSDTGTGSTGTTSGGTDNTSKDNTKYSSGKSDYTLHDGDSLDKKHKIYIKAPSGASIYLDGDYMGKVPCKFDKIIGEHVLTFIKSGYDTMSYTIEVADDGQDALLVFPSLTKSK